MTRSSTASAATVARCVAERSFAAESAGLGLAAAIVGAFFLGGLLNPPPTTPAALPVQELAVRLAATGLQADAGLVKHTWGTELKLEATGLRNGGAYTVTFIRSDGTTSPAGPSSAPAETPSAAA